MEVGDGFGVFDGAGSEIPNSESSFDTEVDRYSIAHAAGLGISDCGNCGAGCPFEAHALSSSKIATQAIVISKFFSESAGMFSIDIVKLSPKFLVPICQCFEIFGELGELGIVFSESGGSDFSVVPFGCEMPHVEAAAEGED